MKLYLINCFGIPFLIMSEVEIFSHLLLAIWDCSAISHPSTAFVHLLFLFLLYSFSDWFVEMCPISCIFGPSLVQGLQLSSPSLWLSCFSFFWCVFFSLFVLFFVCSFNLISVVSMNFLLYNLCFFCTAWEHLPNPTQSSFFPLFFFFQMFYGTSSST